MASLRIQAAVRGYHAYQTVWEPQTGDFFVVLRFQISDERGEVDQHCVYDEALE